MVSLNVQAAEPHIVLRVKDFSCLEPRQTRSTAGIRNQDRLE